MMEVDSEIGLEYGIRRRDQSGKITSYVKKYVHGDSDDDTGGYDLMEINIIVEWDDGTQRGGSEVSDGVTTDCEENYGHVEF